MSVYITATLCLEQDGDQRSATGALGAGASDGTKRKTFQATWLVPDGEPSLLESSGWFPVQSRTRRQQFVFASTATNFQPTNSDLTGFAWEGGIPTAPINLSDYVLPPLRPDQYVNLVVNGLTILTDRFEPGQLVVSVPPGSGSAVAWLEGEEESVFQKWPGRREPVTEVSPFTPNETT